MKHGQIDKLTALVRPGSEATNTGDEKAWQQIRSQCAAPDWLLPFFRTYGSGVFAGFDACGGFIDYLAVMNIFEKPYLRRHRAIGEAFAGSNELSRLPFRFFPEAEDGLFPIAKTDQTMFLLVDPRREGRVFTTDNHLCYFRERRYNYVDYLCLLFQGKKSELWSIPKRARITKVTYIESVRIAQRLGRATYYAD